MHKAPAVETSCKTPTQYLAFKPRQVALLQLRHVPVSMEQKRLSDKQKVLLLRSIAQFLEGSGFSKTLKKFRSEAQIQKQDSEETVFDLEEIFCTFLEKSDHTSKKLESDKAEEVKSKVKKSSDSIGHEKQNSGEACQPVDNSVLATVDKKSKDKKKKKNNSDSEHLIDSNRQPLPESQPITASEKAKDAPLPGSKKMTDSAEENKLKEKKKKKNKLSSDRADKVEQPVSDGKDGADTNFLLDDKNVSSKAKKKKKDTAVSESFSGGKIDDGKFDKIDSENQGLNEKPMEDVNEKQIKGSKKRKRLPVEEDASQSAQEKIVEDSKCRKTDSSEETTGNEQSKRLKLSSGTDGKTHKEESNQGISTPKIDGHANGDLKTNGEKSKKQETAKKQNNGSAEPKSVNRFQRVKVDEVVFSDERLQDNSYWAKDGSESGYGAKAETVLGQVRGRDFRHEKTKKKRGSYRGGQIDVNSHSIKFNYSDDE